MKINLTISKQKRCSCVDLGYVVKISNGEVMVALCGTLLLGQDFLWSLDSRTQASSKQSQQPFVKLCKTQKAASFTHFAQKTFLLDRLKIYKVPIVTLYIHSYCNYVFNILLILLSLMCLSSLISLSLFFLITLLLHRLNNKELFYKSAHTV